MRARGHLRTALLLTAGAPALAAGATERVEEVHVRAAATGVAEARDDAARIPGGVTVVDMRDLERRTNTSIADALRYVPGVWAESSAGNDTTFFSSRGSNLDAADYDHNGVKLLQDGLPVTTADGNNHNRNIDPLSAAHVTIARGANALAYGASTLGGAADFVSPTGRDHPGVRLRLAGGSHGLATTRLTFGHAPASGPDALLTVEGKAWDGYRDHNEQTRIGVYGNVGWQPGDALSTRFFGTYLHNDQELPGQQSRAEYESDPRRASPEALGGHYQLDVESWRLANTTAWTLGDERTLEFGMSLERQALFHPIVDKVMIDVGGPVPIEVFSLLIDTRDRHVNATARYRHSVGGHELIAGVNLARSSVSGKHFRNDGGRRNGLFERIANSARSVELFAFDRWQVDERLMIEVGVQGTHAKRRARTEDVVSGSVAAPSGTYSAVNPRGGLIYRLTGGLDLYANVSRLYEPPTNLQLADDVSADDAALDAMRGLVGEVGIRGGHRGWYFDAAYYYGSIRDEILSVEDPAAPGTSLATNVDKTVHAGLELLLGAELSAGRSYTIEPIVSVTVNDFRFQDHPTYGSNDLPAAPDYVVRGELIVRSARGFYFGPTFDLVGDRQADFANGYEIDGHRLLGLRTGWEGRRWHAFLEAKNLLDERHVATHSVRTVAEPDARLLNPGLPRSVYAGISLSL